MKKLLWISCLSISIVGCAAKSGGDVVSNGLTSGHPTNAMMDEGSCGCAQCGSAKAEGGTCSEKKDASPEADADCGCGKKGRHHHKKKAK